jgi:hypothetical protein
MKKIRRQEKDPNIADKSERGKPTSHASVVRFHARMISRREETDETVTI